MRQGRVYTPALTREYEDRVAWHGRACGHSFGKLAVSVTAHFHVSGKAKGDGDNYLKSVLDGCQKGGVFLDDKSVVDGRFVLHFMAEQPRTEILVFAWPNDSDERIYCHGQLVGVSSEGDRWYCTGCGDDVTGWAQLG